MKPLDIEAEPNLMTSWKLSNAINEPAICVALLEQAGYATKRTDIQESENCGIANNVALKRLSGAEFRDTEMTCGTALRTVMWERHGLQPAAERILRTRITRVRDFGSYSCRRIRTASGTSTRWSTHASGAAIDVSGFEFADGRSANLVNDWAEQGAMGEFLREARDTSCDWFGMTLSPDYNAVHADHFHLQSKGFGWCR